MENYISAKNPAIKLPDYFKHPLMPAYMQSYFLVIKDPVVVANLTTAIQHVDCADFEKSLFSRNYSAYLFRSVMGQPYDVSHFCRQAIVHTVRFDHLLGMVDFAILATTGLIVGDVTCLDLS
jgi:hypothetical protein